MTTFADMEINEYCYCGKPKLRTKPQSWFWDGSIICGNCGKKLQQEDFTRLMM